MLTALRVLLIAALCGAVTSAQTVDPAARIQRRLTALRAELAERPDDPSPRYFLAYYLARSGDTAAALAELNLIAETGDGFLPIAELDFPMLVDHPEFKQIMAKFRAALHRTPDAPLAFTVPDVRLIPEGIAHDPTSGDFFMGSGPQRRIVRIKPDHSVENLSQQTDGLLAVLGLAVDATARRLYAVTTDAFGFGGGNTPSNRILAYDLKSGRKTADWLLPDARALNDVATGADGVLFTSDSDQAMVWRIDTKSGAITALVPPGTFYGINGLAVTDDKKHLYVAHNTGVTRVTLADGTRARLKLPPRQTAAAMDGLYFWRGHLLGIQNVTSPGRVICIRLADDGVTSTAVETLQSHHHPLFESPTTGAVTADGFYVLARTQLNLYEPGKGYTAPEKLRPPAVIRVPLPKF